MTQQSYQWLCNYSVMRLSNFPLVVWKSSKILRLYEVVIGSKGTWTKYFYTWFFFKFYIPLLISKCKCLQFMYDVSFKGNLSGWCYLTHLKMSPTAWGTHCSFLGSVLLWSIMHACIVLALKPVQVPRGLGSLKYCMGILAMVGNNVLADYLLSTEVDM